jgi:hypothetical protein
MDGTVLLIADVLSPCDGTALVIDFLHRYVGHISVHADVGGFSFYEVGRKGKKKGQSFWKPRP